MNVKVFVGRKNGKVEASFVPCEYEYVGMVGTSSVVLYVRHDVEPANRQVTAQIAEPKDWKA